MHLLKHVNLPIQVVDLVRNPEFLLLCNQVLNCLENGWVLNNLLHLQNHLEHNTWAILRFRPTGVLQNGLS